MVKWNSVLVAAILIVAVAYASVPANDGPVAKRDGEAESLLDSVQRRSAPSGCLNRRARRSEVVSRRSGNVSYYSLLFPFFTLCIGFICNVILSKWAPWFPYTVFMMLLGLFTGLLHREANDKNVLSESIDAWDHIDPHLLMFAFLPPLLFGDSMALNFHHVKRCFSQCFLLAGPGVCIGTGLMTLVAKFVLPYSWDWKMAACFASITAATDPVAVVGLLNQLGASKKLTMVIAGESLMNDGIAIVLFTLFKNLLHGQTYDFGGIVEFFFQVALGGPAVGLACGLVALLILILIKNSTEGNDTDNASNQTTLTFVVAYLSFFVGEQVCEVSGVLACVTTGTMIAGYGWPLLSAKHSLHNCWHVAEFMGNTIIFMLSGILIGSDIHDEWQISKGETGKYFGYMIVVYIFMVIIRFVMMGILYFPLSKLGYGFERGWKDAFVGVWGGLRGAVGLILCLIIDEDSTICNDGAPFVVIIGGATFLTLIVNGTTTGPILNALGMLKDPEVQDFLDFSVKRNIHGKTKEYFDNMKDLPEHAEATSEASMTLVDILGETWNATNQREKGAVNNLLEGGCDKATAKHVFRDLYLEMVRTEYQIMIDTNQVPSTSSVPEILLGSIDVALDETDNLQVEGEGGGIYDLQDIKKNFKASWYHNLADGSECGRTVMHQFGRIVVRDRNAYLLHSYLNAHDRALIKFQQSMESLENMSSAVEKLRSTANATLSNSGAGTGSGTGADQVELEPPNRMQETLQKAVKSVTKSHGKNRTEALELIKRMTSEPGNEGVMEVIACKQLAAATLTHQKNKLNKSLSQGVLSKTKYDAMFADVQANMHSLQNTTLAETANSKAFKDQRDSNAHAVDAQDKTLGTGIANVFKASFGHGGDALHEEQL